MRLLIRHTNLVDFPYDSGQTRLQNLFSFDDEKVNSFVSEILYTSPSCYLVSGYRGAGKTSFIRRVCEKCGEVNAKRRKAPETGEEEYKRVLFVYSSFSRFENKTVFLRKIIRDLGETVEKEYLEAPGDGQLRRDLRKLYNATFNEVKREQASSLESSWSMEVGAKTLLKGILSMLPLLTPLLTPYLGELASTVIPSSTRGEHVLLKWLINLGGTIWGVLNTVTFSMKYAIKRGRSSIVKETSLSDDDITEYDLERTLDKFRKQQVKLVFVLDELDKVEDDELTMLLKEMKPWLVRGKADFILVAGQKLTMQYYQVKERDDEILASLFSKVYHIDFLQEEKFIRIFRDLLFQGISRDDKTTEEMLMNELPKQEAAMAYELCNSLIYRSKRIPRTFMNMLRQDLLWDSNKAYLPLLPGSYHHEQIKMRILKGLFDSLAFNADIAETVRGHLIMQLFRAASRVHEGDTHITVDGLMSYVITPWKAEDYPYADTLPVLRECLDLFYQDALREGLIQQPKQVSVENGVASQRKELKNVEESLTAVNGLEAPSEEMDEAMVSEEGEGEGVSPAGKKAPVTADTHVLWEFSEDFLAFVNLLIKLSPVGGIHVNSSSAVITVLEHYTSRHILDVPDMTKILSNQSLSTFQGQAARPEGLFAVYDGFVKNNISISYLLQQLFDYYVGRQLSHVFQNAINLSRINKNDFARFEREVASYMAYVNTAEGKVGLLFNYKFINGKVAITPEEVSRAVGILDDYNQETGIGNYYVNIIFYKSGNPSNGQKLSLTAHQLVQNINERLDGKVRYFIIHMSFYEGLTQQLTALRQSIASYPISPIMKPGVTKGSISVPDHNRKGKWGGKTEVKGRRLRASIIKEEKDLFNIQLSVVSTKETNPLTGKVTFYLPESFTPSKFTVNVRDGVAELSDLYSYDPFIVGATCDNNLTSLELDLNNLANLPEGFKAKVARKK